MATKAIQRPAWTPEQQARDLTLQAVGGNPGRNATTLCRVCGYDRVIGVNTCALCGCSPRTNNRD